MTRVEPIGSFGEGRIVTEETAIDKSDWGNGPWTSEPDRLEFEHAGFPCLLNRGPGGHWCGYVAVPPTHPDYRKDYDSVGVEAHGGLTYAHECQGAICHVPKPGEPDDVWWLGFDCAHCGDYSPRYGGKYWGQGYPWPDKKYDHAEQVAKQIGGDWGAEVYRDIAYVRAETERLADQLALRKARGEA